MSSAATATVAGVGNRRAQIVLAGVVALQLVAETALTPYWPMMFRQLFGIDELAATGSFLTVARVAGLVALPLWGLAALRWPVRTLLVAGLVLSALLDFGLAVAPTWWTFTLVAAGLVASGSVLVLAYPALIEVTERPGRADRRTGVVTYWAVFHASMVLATLVGASIVALQEPRWGLAAFGAVDLLLALAVLAMVPAVPPGPAAPRAARTRRSRRTARPRAARWREVRPWLVLIVAVVAVDAAFAVPRPYYVELMVSEGVTPTLAGWLFLVPGVASLLLLPVTPWLIDRLGRATATAAAALGGTGLLIQAYAVVADTPEGVVAGEVIGRLLFGAGTGVMLVLLDLAVFDRIGTHGAAFSAMETGRQAALLAAPVIATAVAGAWLGAPLLVAAAILLVAGALFSTSRVRPGAPVTLDNQETEHVLDLVR